MAYYHTCPKCGSNLDPGENCDCEEEAAERDRFYAENLTTNPITGQMAFDWDGKESSYEKNKTVNKRRNDYRSSINIDTGFRAKMCG